jgi:hypothetical protein
MRLLSHGTGVPPALCIVAWAMARMPVAMVATAPRRCASHAQPRNRVPGRMAVGIDILPNAIAGEA